MSSLYDELTEKLNRDPRLTRKGGPRVDLSLLLFNAREDVHQLWQAAARCAGSPDGEALRALQEAVDRLRPIFGERSRP